jgi:hypothetical protein
VEGVSQSKTWTVQQLAQATGRSRRQIARYAAAQCIPGAHRSNDGYHWQYPNSPALRAWIRRTRQTAHGSKFGGALTRTPKKFRGIELWQGVRGLFNIMQRQSAPSRHLWDQADREAFLELMAPVAQYVAAVNEEYVQIGNNCRLALRGPMLTEK